MASILNVDKIRATGSTTDGVLIDSSGRVTTPAHPHFVGIDTSGLTDTDSESTFATIVHYTVKINTGGCYNTSTGSSLARLQVGIFLKPTFFLGVMLLIM